jgi:hypothetical protein
VTRLLACTCSCWNVLRSTCLCRLMPATSSCRCFCNLALQTFAHPFYHGYRKQEKINKDQRYACYNLLILGLKLLGVGACAGHAQCSLVARRSASWSLLREQGQRLCSNRLRIVSGHLPVHGHKLGLDVGIIGVLQGLLHHYTSTHTRFASQLTQLSAYTECYQLSMY